MSEFQYFSFFLLYALGFLSLLRKAQTETSFCLEDVSGAVPVVGFPPQYFAGIIVVLFNT